MLWENLSISDSERDLRLTFSMILISLVLLFSFLVILAVDVGEGLIKNIFSKVTTVLQLSVSIVSALVIMVVNKILSYIIHQTIFWEKHKTISNAKYSLVSKLVISQFFNSALIYYFVAKISISFAALIESETNIETLLVERISVLMLTRDQIRSIRKNIR